MRSEGILCPLEYLFKNFELVAYIYKFKYSIYTDFYPGLINQKAWQDEHHCCCLQTGQLSSGLHSQRSTCNPFAPLALAFAFRTASGDGNLILKTSSCGSLKTCSPLRNKALLKKTLDSVSLRREQRQVSCVLFPLGKYIGIESVHGLFWPQISPFQSFPWQRSQIYFKYIIIWLK